MSSLERWFDERFLEHRRRSTSLAGIVAAELALVMFVYQLLARHMWRWDLLAVGATFVVVKLAMMTYYRLKD